MKYFRMLDDFALFKMSIMILKKKVLVIYEDIILTDKAINFFFFLGITMGFVYK